MFRGWPMARYFDDLQQFISRLEEEGELVRITVPVSRDLEISEIYFRHARSPDGGKALLFENTEGSPIPVLINAFGSDRRMEIAFGDRSLDEMAAEMKEILGLLQFKPPKGISDMLGMAMQGKKILKYPPVKTRFKKAPVQEVIWQGDEIDLNKIPIIKSWPEDGGRFVTLGLTLTESLHSSSRNLGMYRLQQLDKKSLAMHWQIHKDGSHFWQEYRKENKRMPVSVIIGSDPATIFSATAPMPPNIYELLMAGFIRGRGVSVVKGITNDLYVPANSEIVLEGYVDPDELVDEGPFGDHTGYYTPVEKFPVFHVTAITMRNNPVYAATVVGRSPQEDCYLARATERLFLPLLQVVAPEVTDQMLPWDGNFHNCAVFSLNKSFPFQGRKLMNHLWGFSQMSFAKSIVTVDGDVNLHTGETLFRHILTNIHVDRDVYISEGILDQLDHSGLRPLFGGKLGVDATTKLSEELYDGSESGVALKKDPGKKGTGRKTISGEKEIQKFYKEVTDRLKKAKLILQGIRLYGSDLPNPVLILAVQKKKGQGRLSQLVRDALKPADRTFPASIILIVDGGDDVNHDSLLLWRMFGNVDPLRDCVKETSEKHTDLGAIVLDATAKGLADGYHRVWPKENRMDDVTIALVDSKWKDMFGEEPFPVERP